MSRPKGAKNKQRSATGMTAEQATTSGLGTSDPRDPNAEIKTKQRRIPMGQGMNLDMSAYEMDEENFHYHIFAEHPEKPGRIAQARRAGYEFAVDSDNQQIVVPSGSGQAFLMKQPMEFWLEDLALKRAKVQRTMDQQDQIAPNEYAPDPLTHAPEGGRRAIARVQGNPFS